MRLMLFFLLAIYTKVYAQDWNSSPYNWENDPNNWKNSADNWNNNPSNWNNNLDRWGNDRVVRDNNGNPAGYAIPKANGGVNFFDPYGDRQWYLPPTQ